MSEHAFIVVIRKDNKSAEVEIYDGASETPEPPIAQGSGATWRGALGEALSQIELPKEDKDESK